MEVHGIQVTPKWGDYLTGLKGIERSCMKIDRVFDGICAILEREEVTLQNFKYIVDGIERLFEHDVSFKLNERMPFQSKDEKK